MKFPRHNKIFRGQLDAGPYMAVFFLLIVFLLFNSSLVFTPGVPINLPDAVNLPGTANPTVVVVVEKNGQLYFENQVSDEARLQEKLRAAVANSTEPVTLIVQADRDARNEVVVRLGLLARAAGIKEALIATRSPVVPRPSKL